MALNGWEPTNRFRRDYKRLDPQLQAKVDEAIQALIPWPTNRAYRHHTLGGYTPPVHVIDVTTNHSHQLSFIIVDGTVARLLRVATHREIDRSPE